MRISTRIADVTGADAAAEVIAAVKPTVIVQAASAQGGAVIATQGNAWSKLIADGGLSATAVFQTLLSSRVARGLGATGHEAFFVNCCYADVVNSLIAALGLPITTGVGNVSILSNMFAGDLDQQNGHKVKVLAHYQTIGVSAAPRTTARAPSPVSGSMSMKSTTCVRASELFSSHQSPSSILSARAASDDAGHGSRCTVDRSCAGPLGLSGGYPVKFAGGVLALDLPAALTRDDAVHWNAAFEERNGLVVESHGRARYTGSAARSARRLQFEPRRRI